MQYINVNSQTGTGQLFTVLFTQYFMKPTACKDLMMTELSFW